MTLTDAELAELAKYGRASRADTDSMAAELRQWRELGREINRMTVEVTPVVGRTYGEYSVELRDRIRILLGDEG